MAELRPIEPVIRFCGVIARDDGVRQWAIDRLTDHWGGIIERGPATPFVANGFYDDQMGPGLTKVLVGFAGVADPAGLADWKTQTIAWERDAESAFPGPDRRPLNLDPGYLTQAKLVLATVKDRDHRLYLKDGIFAEVTLNYVGKRWVHHRWTYPDYRVDEVFAFANRCRVRLREHLVATGGFRHV